VNIYKSVEVTRAYWIVPWGALCVVSYYSGTIRARRWNVQTYVLHGRENFQRISPETQDKSLNNDPTWKNNIKVFSKGHFMKN